MSKIKYGLENVYFAPRTEAEGGTVSYGTPVAVPGAVTASVSNNINSNTFWADDGPYFVTNDKSNKTIDLEVADIAREIMTEYLGYVKAQGGGIIETDQAVNKPFALLFQILTDESARKFCYYNCTASEGDEDHSTKEDSIEPQTSNLSVTCSGEQMDNGKRAYRHISDKGDADYDSFFTKVTMPVEATDAAPQAKKN